MNIRALSLPLLLAIALPGWSEASPAPFTVCIDYHCDLTRRVWLDDGKWERVRQLFLPPSNPAQERRAIADAIGLLERLVGPLVGTDRDQAENQGPGDVVGQLDCIAESRNSKQYLELLFEAGLLRWHVPQPRVVRNPLFFNVHWTAVIRERESGRDYAVDSWFRPNGEKAVIQPLPQWLAGADFSNE